MKHKSLTIFLCLVFFLYPARAEDARVLAVFRCEMYDTSGGTDAIRRAQEETRLDRTTQTLRDGYDASPLYTTMDGAQAKDVDSPYARLAQDGIVSQCLGCEADLARAIGATHSLGCLVHKVSNLIMSITIYMRDANTGAILEQHSADLRGNSDQSWERTAQWLLKNRAFEDPKLREERLRRMRGDY